MAVLPTIQQVIDRGYASISLAANYNANRKLWVGQSLTPVSPLTILLVTEALQWGYEGGAQTEQSLRSTSNYLIWLTGMFGNQAAELIAGGGGGSITPIPPSSAIQFPFYITSSDFQPDGVTYVNSKLVGFNIALFINEYTQQFFPGTDFTYLPTGGFTITAPGFDANNFQYTIRVEQYFQPPS